MEKVNKCNQADGDDKGMRLLNLVPAHLSCLVFWVFCL